MPVGDPADLIDDEDDKTARREVRGSKREMERGRGRGRERGEGEEEEEGEGRRGWRGRGRRGRERERGRGRRERGTTTAVDADADADEAGEGAEAVQDPPALTVEENLKLIKYLISTTKNPGKPVLSVLIDHLAYETALIVTVGSHVVNMLGWDLKPMQNKHDAVEAANIIIGRFNDLMGFAPFLDRIHTLRDIYQRLHRDLTDYRLLADSLIQLFPVICPSCNYMIRLENDLWLKFNIIMFINRLAAATTTVPATDDDTGVPNEAVGNDITDTDGTADADNAAAADDGTITTTTAATDERGV